MSTLPQGWDFDYDGTRWFYTYKASGHIQYHFPSEGDEFPDFVDAASPAPALAPEERLESQRQQVRRAASLNQPAGASAWHQARQRQYGFGREREEGGMSAKATPVSYVWEETVQHNEAYVAPESFMYLGSGTHLDVSPLPSERAESSPAGSFLSPSDGRSRHASPPEAQWVLPAQSPRFSPYASSNGASSHQGVFCQGGFQGTEQISYLDTTGAVHGPDGEEAVPMLDGRETVHMLDGAQTIHMLDDTSVVHMLDGREVPSELPGVEAQDLRLFNPAGTVAEMDGEDLVEMPAEEALVPPVDGMVKTSLEAEEDLQVALKQLEEDTGPRESTAPEAPQVQELGVTTAIAPSGAARTDPPPGAPGGSNGDALAPQPVFKIARKPTSGSYKPYKAGTVANERPRMSTDVVSGQTALRREDSLLMGSGTNRGDGQSVDSTDVPSALALRQKHPQEALVAQDAVKGEDNRDSVSHPSVLDPSKRSSQEVPSSPPGPPRNIESPIDPAADPSPEAPGIMKFPSVLKPARGRAPSIPPRETLSKGLPRKLYEQIDSDPGPVEEGDKKYKPYRGPEPQDVMADTQRSYSDVQPTFEGPPQAQQPSEERHLPYRLLRQNSAEVHQPTSISASDGGVRPIATFNAMPGLNFGAGGVPSPASSDATPPPGTPATKVLASPESVDQHRGTTPSDMQQQHPSPESTRRRGSSVVSNTQTPGDVPTWTPSPSSDTTPPIPQVVLNQRRPSLLRHSVPHDAANDSSYDSDMTSHISSNSNRTTPISAAPVSSAHSEDSPAHFSAVNSIRRLSLPYSLLEDSDTSPNTPPPPLKHSERQQPRSRHGQTTPDSAASGPSPSPALEVPPSQIEMGGHVLHAIEEDEEPPIEEKRMFIEGYSASSGSIQITPPMVKRGDYFAMAPHPGAMQPSRVENSGSSIVPQEPMQSPVVEELLRANRHSMQQNSTMAPVQSRPRSVSSPVSPSARQYPVQQAASQFTTMKTPVTPMNRHDVPQIQLPNPTLYHQQSTQMQSTPPTVSPQQWYLTMPAPGMPMGTTTQVYSPGQAQTQKERGWKKLFKKSPAKEAPPLISAPQPQPQPQQGYFPVPMYQNHPDIQHLYQQPLQQAPAPQGTVQLPPAVGDRPGVSRIPGFAVADRDAAPRIGRMPTVRRNSALASNPFDASQMPAPLFDKETAP